MKVRRGTRNFLHEAAMTLERWNSAWSMVPNVWTLLTGRLQYH